jgi:DNA replication protein DnaC
MNFNNEFSREEILKLIQSLKLIGMMEAYDEVVADTIRRKATSSYCLYQLLKAEAKTRTLKALQARLRGARFPAMKDLDNFIFTDTPVSQEQVMHLYSTEFVKTSRNIYPFPMKELDLR